MPETVKSWEERSTANAGGDKALRNSEGEVMEEIEAYLGNVDITSDRSVNHAQFDFAFI